MDVLVPIVLLIAGLFALVAFSRVLFRSNRTRVVRARSTRLRRHKPAVVEPELNWRTLVG